MATAHPLERPVWSALTGGWARFAQGDGRALRLDPAYGPFLASADGNAEAVAALIPPEDEGWTLEHEAVAPLRALHVERTALCVQMVAEAPVPPAPNFAFEELGEADADEMRALAALTRPGPFRAMTHRLGSFIGVRHGERLVAMAGERMRCPGFAEVSGVCTHPDFRGRGLAGGPMRMVAARIVQTGETPFLHAYADHASTIRLYEALGYRKRSELVLTILRHRVEG